MDGVEISVISSNKGRGLVAKKNYPNGSVIFEEDPIVSCQFSWNAAYKYKACDHCMRPLESAQENAQRLTGNSDLVLPYPECCTTNRILFTSCPVCCVDYCSVECQQTAFNQYHFTLCHPTQGNSAHPLDRLNEAWKQIHYPPETNTVMIIPRILAIIQQADDKNLKCDQFLKFCHRTVAEDTELAHKLLGDKYMSQLTLLHSLLVNAVQHDHVEQFLSMEGFLSLMALIGTNGQGVGTSPISQWVKNISNLSLSEQDRQEVDVFIDQLYQDMADNVGCFLDNEGVALYSMQSICNHSCVANACVTFNHNNHRLSLVAQRDIEAGEEICISYFDSCEMLRSRHSRQKKLAENYLFICDCSKCEEQINDPDETSEEEEEEDEEMS